MTRDGYSIERNIDGGRLCQWAATKARKGRDRYHGQYGKAQAWKACNA